MKLRQLLAAPFDFLANAIDPAPPRTFWQKLLDDPAIYSSIQSLINVFYTGYVHADQAKSVAASSAHAHDHIKEISDRLDKLVAASSAHAHDHIKEISDRLDKLVAEKLIEKGIRDPLPRPGELLGDYISRLEKARVGGLLWTWDDEGKRWAALVHHIHVNDWTPEKHVDAAHVEREQNATPASTS
jgi:hypothetical protein